MCLFLKASCAPVSQPEGSCQLRRPSVCVCNVVLRVPVLNRTLAAAMANMGPTRWTLKNHAQGGTPQPQSLIASLGHFFVHSRHEMHSSALVSKTPNFLNPGRITIGQTLLHAPQSMQFSVRSGNMATKRLRTDMQAPNGQRTLQKKRRCPIAKTTIADKIIRRTARDT
jgi:hypothetical protein